jgi:branched-chain amino acid transport system permease protein
MTETNPITTAADESNETVTHVGRVAAQMHDASGVHVSRMRGTAIAVVLVLLVAGWGMGLGSVANVHIASMVLMFAALAQGWNVLGGYAGYINFGTVMFFGLGAYTTAITAAAWHLNPLVTAPLAGLASALFAVVIGIPTLRLRGGYFAIATFVLAIAVQSLALVLGITHGSQGLFISPLGMTIGASTRLFFLLFLGLAVLGTLMCWFVEHSRWHSALVAIREDEDAAEVLGVPTVRLKSMALIAGAVMAGVVGSFYATQLFYIEPTGTFDSDLSLAVVVAAVIGGAGTWYGPLIGAIITQLLAQELLVHVQGVYNQLSYGALLVVVVLTAPRGLASLLRRPHGRRFSV